MGIDAGWNMRTHGNTIGFGAKTEIQIQAAVNTDSYSQNFSFLQLSRRHRGEFQLYTTIWHQNQRSINQHLKLIQVSHPNPWWRFLGQYKRPSVSTILRKCIWKDATFPSTL